MYSFVVIYVDYKTKERRMKQINMRNNKKIYKIMQANVFSIILRNMKDVIKVNLL